MTPKEAANLVERMEKLACEYYEDSRQLRQEDGKYTWFEDGEPASRAYNSVEDALKPWVDTLGLAALMAAERRAPCVAE